MTFRRGWRRSLRTWVSIAFLATVARTGFAYIKRAPELRDNPWFTRTLVAITIVLAFLYPILDSNDPRVSTAVIAEVYVLLALGLNIVVGFAGLLDLGYAAFFAIGAYTAAVFASTHVSVGAHCSPSCLIPSPVNISNLLFSIGPGGIHVNFFALIPIAALVAAFFGISFGAPTLRLRGDYLAIVTLGFGEIVPIVVEQLGQGNGVYLGRHGSMAMPNLTNGVNNITGIDAPPDINFLWIHWTWSTNDPRPWYFLALAVVLISVVLVLRLRDSRIGRSWVAIREDEIAAAHAGVNITAARLTAFALGAAFSGFAGLLYAARIASVSYTSFFFQTSVTILVMVVLGGIGSVPGVILGGILIAYLSQTWLSQLAADLNGWGANIHHDWGPVGAFGRWLQNANLVSAKPLILGVILVCIILLRPQGLIPNRRRARELRPETALEAAEEQEELYTLRTGEI